ncbi:lipocalin family protein [Pedobacter aquatilis]|uniref:lipocalin family protein n=1 Tax=Pedobacter aquatilis TaxID=351343 RepID=UPI00292E39F5|nr:lipocalin family protein [Pedobacter aquatilis]
MKKKITILSLLFVASVALFSCKKDTTSLKARMMGKWTVNKIEVSGNSNELLNGTTNYTINDYMDFKSNNDDQVELSLSNQRTIGTYTVSMGNEFGMVFPEGTSYCTVSTLSDTQLRFTAKIDKSTIVKVYYLTR